jgi:ABC-2 type transport system permease protein
MIFSIFKMELKRLITYRFEFWIQIIVGTAVNLCLVFFFWKAVFEARGTAQIGEYDFKSLMFYYLLMFGLERVVRGQDFGYLSQDIYNGNLSRYLIYPLSVFTYKATLSAAQSLFCLFQLLLLIALFFGVWGVPTLFSISPLSSLQTLFTLALAFYLHFLIATSLELVAFWMDQVWSLAVMLRFIASFMGGVYLPITFFPEGLKAISPYLPFYYFYNFPTQVWFGKVSPEQFIFGFSVLAFWIFTFHLINALLWNKGIKNYAGVGI